MKKHMILAALAVLAMVGTAAAQDNLTCSRGNYKYDSTMKPAAIAVHEQVKATATCAPVSDPTVFIGLSLVRAAQNPGGGDSGGGQK